jgi:hypothetical protein
MSSLPADAQQSRVAQIRGKELGSFEQAELCALAGATDEERRNGEEELVDQASVEERCERMRTCLGEDHTVAAVAEKGNHPRHPDRWLLLQGDHRRRCRQAARERSLALAGRQDEGAALEEGVVGVDLSAPGDDDDFGRRGPIPQRPGGPAPASRAQPGRPPAFSRR